MVSITKKLRMYGWGKVILMSLGFTIAFIGFLLTLAFFLLFVLEKYDGRYVESEQVKVHMEEYIEYDKLRFG